MESLVTGKEGNVAPVFKKGRKRDPGNYQPVSKIVIILEINVVSRKALDKWKLNQGCLVFSFFHVTPK